MTIKYGEFTFDSAQGFTGSTGKKAVKGYMRGGATKMAQNVELAKSRAATAFAKSKPASKFKTGGKARHYAEGSDGGVKSDDGPTIESIIEDTKDMKVPAQKPMKSSGTGDVSPSDAKRMRQIMEKTNSGTLNMARGGGATTVPIRMAPAYKPPRLPSVPAAMATPMALKPKAPPSLANIAMSRNPQMLKMGGRSKKK